MSTNSPSHSGKSPSNSGKTRTYKIVILGDGGVGKSGEFRNGTKLGQMNWVTNKQVVMKLKFIIFWDDIFRINVYWDNTYQSFDGLKLLSLQVDGFHYVQFKVHFFP